MAKESEKKEEAKKEEPKQVSLRKLFSIASNKEMGLVAVGIICSLGSALSYPLFSVLLGEMMVAYGAQTSIMDAVSRTSLYLLILSIGVFILIFIGKVCWTFFGHKISFKYRKMYMQVILQQDITYFDKNKPQEIPTQMNANCASIEDAVGEKLGQVFQTIASFVAGLVVSFYYAWHLAFVMCAVGPLVVLGTKWLFKTMVTTSVVNAANYAKCGGMAEQAITNIRTVAAYGETESESNKYESVLRSIWGALVKSSLKTSANMAFFKLTFTGMYAMGYYFGSLFIQNNIYIHKYTGDNGYYNGASVITCFYSFICSFFMLGQAIPQSRAIAAGRIAAYKFWELADSVKKSESNKPTQTIPADKFEGRIEFKNVEFAYPIHNDVPVIKGLTMKVNPRESLGICGKSGSGKSTVIQLIEKFYNVDKGTITIDGIDIKELDPSWLRSQIGYVSQNPVLFNVSIYDNVSFGKNSATKEEVINALTAAHCMEFVNHMEKKEDTIVGSSQLSGGQKQRIAIARAILKQPKILLLDEATSSLDKINESEVQNAIEAIRGCRTCISVAHRLSTIEKCNNIIVIADGKIKEEGSHESLMMLNEAYAGMYTQQMKRDDTYEPAISPEDIKLSEKPSPEQNNTHTTQKLNQIQRELTEKVEKETKREDAYAIGMANYSKRTAFNRLLKLNRLFPPVVFGCIIFSILEALFHTTFGYLFSVTQMAFNTYKTNYENFCFVTVRYSLYFFILAIAKSIIGFANSHLFNLLGQNITFRIRSVLYRKILGMPVSWFDQEKYSSSKLNSILSDDTRVVNQAVESIIGLYLQGASALVAGTIIAFICSWRTALTIMILAPIMFLTGVMRMRAYNSLFKKSQAAYDEANKLLNEAAQNKRTIASFANEDKVHKLFCDSLLLPEQICKKTSLLSGLAIAISEVALYLVFALAFYCMGIYITNFSESPDNVMIAMFVFVTAANATQEANQYTPELGKAKIALENIYVLYDSKTQDTLQDSIYRPEIFKGKIQFKDVWFKYPTRKQWVLKQFNMTINPGEKIGIVGMSGHGKSTIVQLIMRFYDVTGGELLIDDKNIKSYDLKYLRQKLGYVSQDPCMFDVTIEQNIKYGTPNASYAEIEEFSKCVDIHDILKKNLKDVGNKGELISGGQKQRIAIARAYLRNPCVLLLDEATSALPKDTEDLVLKPLAKYKSDGKVVIMVAHRYTNY